VLRIEIEPVWRFTRDNGAPSMLVTCGEVQTAKEVLRTPT
jgi:hypothetical protein